MSGFQITSGLGALNTITGVTSIVGGDSVDAYCIKITDPAAFFAATSAGFPGATEATSSFDTRLFLFTLAGVPVMMNDDFPSASPFRSAIADPALWTGTGEIIVDGPIALPAGDYILAITGFSNNIENAANEDLFRIDSLFDFDALYGPDQGILGPAHHWESPAGDTSGSYTIALGGATYSVPAPGALVVLGVTWVIRRRR